MSYENPIGFLLGREAVSVLSIDNAGDREHDIAALHPHIRTLSRAGFDLIANKALRRSNPTDGVRVMPALELDRLARLGVNGTRGNEEMACRKICNPWQSWCLHNLFW